MKIRNSFVSNSSSTSFILKFDKPIEDYTYEEFERLMEYENPIRQIWDELNDTKNLGDNEYSITLGSDYQTSEGEHYLYDHDLECIKSLDSNH